jgi:multiple sugar transport system ATP-binding protein
LFDEPLSNLDAKLRVELRMQIKQLHQQLGNTMIYVTHDQIEALTLADRVAVMKDGIIQQLASPGEIYQRPINRFVADFIGSPSMNFFEGRIENGTFRVADSSIPLTGYEAMSHSLRSGQASLGIRPEHITINATSPHPFQADSTIQVVEPMGADTLIWTELAGAPLAIRVEGERTLDVGDSIRLSFDPSRASLFDAESGERL